VATFLELCADLAAQSGAIRPAPTTVIGQVGRQKLCVDWVRKAWVKIQNVSPYWSWLRAEFEGTLTIGDNSYTAAELSIATRFKEWIGDNGRGRGLSLYDPAIGRKDETELLQISYERWRRSYNFRTHDNARPTEWAIAPDGGIRFGSTPDKAYKVRGEYRKTPQVLAADTDVPECPDHFHDIIWHRGIMLMAETDEAVTSLQTSQVEYKQALADLSRDHLPQFTIGSSGPLDQ
jgi:hypothetical protein